MLVLTVQAAALRGTVTDKATKAPKQKQAGVVPVCLLPVLHIGAGLVHQGILAVVIGKCVVVQITVLQTLCRC